jgi:hypothetical protein
MDGAHRLTFLLPPTMQLRVAQGRHQPCLHGVTLFVRGTLVSIEGPSREQTFDQVKRFFRVNAKQLPPFTVTATLQTPQRRGPPARDGWTIVVNSDVTLTPAAIVDIARPPPEEDELDVGVLFDRRGLTIIGAG